MASAAFVDSNVLVYFVDRDEPSKRTVARRFLAAEARNLVISTQVLSEFYWITTRKLPRPLSEEVAARLVTRWSRLRTLAVDAKLVRAAIAIGRQAQIAYWDALILAAAQASGCERVLTEDLQDGATIAGVQIENPFRGID